MPACYPTESAKVPSAPYSPVTGGPSPPSSPARRACSRSSRSTHGATLPALLHAGLVPSAWRGSSGTSRNVPLAKFAATRPGSAAAISASSPRAGTPFVTCSCAWSRWKYCDARTSRPHRGLYRFRYRKPLLRGLLHTFCGDFVEERRGKPRERRVVEIDLIADSELRYRPIGFELDRVVGSENATVFQNRRGGHPNIVERLRRCLRAKFVNVFLRIQAGGERDFAS
jgi:hypothetical protein